jgi:hypothetical protein
MELDNNNESVLPKDVYDIDIAEHDDPQYCTAYVKEIYQNLRQAEVTFRLSVPLYVPLLYLILDLVFNLHG